jgi:2-C-methyl-D-erythritol 2,4-cyclodiphosphate synthase
MIRIGFGYDVHKIVENRPLVLGGLEIPWEFGLLGHSDADVLVHAMNDAILGALALGDIGIHFPDTDNQYKDIYSIRMMEKVVVLMEDRGYEVNNVDGTIVAQRPKLAPYMPRMVQILSKTLKVPADRINIKATTSEGLGFEGRMEGISAYAVCTLVKKKNSE